MTYEVKLDVFEGPFQLILSLIAEQRLDVCDVPIARLTEDYLKHIEQMERADLDVTTEFLVVAATLLSLKAKALLPEPATDADEDEQLERDLLIARLLEVQTFQTAGDNLATLLAMGDKRFPARALHDDEALRGFPVLEGIDASDVARTLVALVQELLRTVDTSKVVVDQVSTQEASAELVERLESGPLRFGDIARGRNLAWSVALFLAMLELAMRGEIMLGDGRTVGELEIRLSRNDR
ncbi:MAG TPA: segregation/condensation protein A [Actinomycetota bacterium]|nr:segregation/condensation protein A [Actinomycetota bacterium]